MKKRIVSLFLALACALSLTSPALAAEEPYFKDEKDIVHLEAAEAMVRLGVMGGKEDGSYFDPRGAVTRAEAAKHVATLLNGGEDLTGSSSNKSAPPAFPDVKGHWAEGWINYCAEKGVAFAQKDGNFDPNGRMGKYDLLRMCLATLGHDVEKRGLGDPNDWLRRTDALARYREVFEEVLAPMGQKLENSPLTRDEAAYILYAALNSAPILVDAEKRVEEDTLSMVTEYVLRPDGTPSTLLRENFGYDSWDDVPAMPDKAKQEEPKPRALRGIDPTTLSDAKDVQYWPAVASLCRLGIISGRDDGSFDPAGKVTRAEAAKMISVLMNGGSEANTGAKKSPSFTDIQGHWAEGYIEYCADMGIVSGWDGRFDPEGQVSVLQFYKMALAALGYGPEAYALVGSRWAEQTLERARSADGRALTEGLPNDGLDGTGADLPATREVAAQILYNALLANPIMISPDGRNDDGSVIWKYSAREDDTLLHQRFDLKQMPVVPPQPTV